MKLSDVRDYIESLHISEFTYMSRMDSKKEKSIGVYNSKHNQAYQTAIGGISLKSYDTKYVTLLVHWNRYPKDTEDAATRLFEALENVRDVTINNVKIKFIQLLNSEPVDVGVDANGICEMVIEAAIIYER
jgi:hypothetical protein